MLARDRRESFKKVVDRFACLKIVKQRLHGNPGPVEHCCATHHIGSEQYNWLSHGDMVQGSAPQCAFDGELQTSILLGLTNTPFIDSINHRLYDQSRSCAKRARPAQESIAGGPHRQDKTRAARLPGARVDAVGAPAPGNSAPFKSQLKCLK
jgi:hypothetical protein